MRLPRTVATFSVWKWASAMQQMVRGHSDMANAARHADAMVERDRKDFQFEFTKLRLLCLRESGT